MFAEENFQRIFVYGRLLLDQFVVYGPPRRGNYFMNVSYSNVNARKQNTPESEKSRIHLSPAKIKAVGWALYEAYLEFFQSCECLRSRKNEARFQNKKVVPLRFYQLQSFGFLGVSGTRSRAILEAGCVLVIAIWWILILGWRVL